MKEKGSRLRWLTLFVPSFRGMPLGHLKVSGMGWGIFSCRLNQRIISSGGPKGSPESCLALAGQGPPPLTHLAKNISEPQCVSLRRPSRIQRLLDLISSFFYGDIFVASYFSSNSGCLIATSPRGTTIAATAGMGLAWLCCCPLAGLGSAWLLCFLISKKESVVCFSRLKHCWSTV